jgi:type II secretory pathway pseudopilin PulG
MVGVNHLVKGTDEMTSLSTLARAARLGSTRKRGVTLIEAVLYISIALALIVGGLVFFQQASLAQRTNSAVRNISAIASETRGLYQQQNNFAGFTQAALINAGAVPTSLISGTDLRNEWGGTILAASTGGTGAGADSGFTVTYPGLPRAACVRLTSSDSSGSGRVGSGIRSIAFKLPATASFPAAVLPASDALSPTAVSGATLCGLGDIVDVQFTFNR